MRRFFTSLLFLMALSSISAWGAILYFPEKLVEFPNSGDPQPEIRDNHKYYRQYVWWSWSDDGSDPFALTGTGITGYEVENDFLWSVDVTGNLSIPQGKYVTKNGNHYELSNSEIYFDGTSGTITLTATQPDFNGVPYSASYTIRYHMGIEKITWDFNTKPFTILGDSWWWDNETHMSTPIEDHWAYKPFKYAITYGANENNQGPGNIIAEAAGLRFETDAYGFGYNNPGFAAADDNSSKDKNIESRFICFKAGSKLYIPKEILSNYTKPRVRIKMNRDAVQRNGQASVTMNLIVNNALDAVGKPINTNNGYYGIGGSAWWGKGKGDYLYRGEYHFQVVDNTQDFSIEVPANENGPGWLLIYTIEVYDSEEMITENDVLGSSYQFLTTKYTDKDGEVTTNTVSPASADYWVHYRGKAEHSTVSNCTTSGTVGTLGAANVNGTNFVNRFVSNGQSDTKHTYTPVSGEYGSFRMRLEVHDHNNNYITDYAYRTQSVGLMENKQYPYTWDFTDINTYKNANFSDDKGVATVGTEKMGMESGNGYATQPTNNYVTGVTYVPRNVWDTDGTFRIANNGGHDVLFAGGSQLWYGKTIIPEAAGLAFTPVNYDGAYNGAMTLTSNGLLFNQKMRDWWLWRVMIPQVDNKCTIYVRARKLASTELLNANYYNVGYYYGDATNKTEKLLYSTAALTETKAAREIAVDDESGDVIYAIPAPSSTTNVTLFFQGVEVHKIAVSKDPKTVNKYGWATESRDHVIDQELTSYFTDKDFVTYLVQGVNSNNTTVSLTEVDMDETVMELSNGSDYNAYIIRNRDAEILKNDQGEIVKDEDGYVVATGKVDILATGDGFHLFVPDIHDYVKIGDNTSTYNQKTVNSYEPLLKAKLTPGKVETYETIGGVKHTNFVLTWQVADIEEEQQGSDYDFENVGFFRVQNSGVTSKGNQGYLPLNLGSGGNINKFNLVWADDANGIDDAIVSNAALRNDNVYYNLSGQRLNGVPTKGGIYIVNGKKIVVK